MMDQTGYTGWALLKTAYFVIAAFVFSVIFWLTHNWLVKDPKKKR